MKNAKKILLLKVVTIATTLIISCSKDNEISPPEPKIIAATCQDGIKNQDETTIDCGGTCGELNCTPIKTYPLEEGKYKGLWNSTATNGSVYTNLKITATINKVTEGKYTGALYISDNYTSCCNSGSNGDGPITINITDGKITFKWIDKIPFCLGEFNGTGTYSDNNKMTLKLSGKDCEGDHLGSISFFKQ